jgi:hypothetical protein
MTLPITPQEKRSQDLGKVMDSLWKPTPNQLWLERAAARLRQIEEAQAKVGFDEGVSQ